MIASAEFLLDCNTLQYKEGSNMHGMLFSKLSSSYADSIHNNQIKPFSQYIKKDTEGVKWVVNTLDVQAYENILLPLMDSSFKTFKLNTLDKEISVLSKSKLSTSTYEELFDLYYIQQKVDRVTRLKFVSPTSFKINGEYELFPSVFHIYQSLLNRWNYFSGMMSLEDQQTLEQIAQNTFVRGYQLQTKNYYVDRARINGFLGELQLYVKGPETLVRLTNLLFEYAKYAGIGIKTSLGMGAVLKM